MKRVAVLIVDRANYGRLRPVMFELKERKDIELVTICAGTMLLDRFGKAANIVEQDGFRIDSRVYMELEGSTPITMTKSLGYSIVEFSSELARLKPDILLVIGDRYEALGAVLAASYMNICVAHIQGGEVSGSIDECARHAMTKFSQYHFPATERAKDFIVRMGESPENVFQVGCPVADVLGNADLKLTEGIFAKGVGADVTHTDPYFLVMFHPTTTEFERSGEEILEVLKALVELNHKTIWIWPNIDAGGDAMSHRLRQYRENNDTNWLRLIKNFKPEEFQKVLANAKCAIGNSSSFVRDSTFFGTPVVLVGERQKGREIAENTIPVETNSQKILAAVHQQVKHGRYPASTLYGTKGASKRIADLVAQLKPTHKKHLHYISL